jgi:capsular exopolysaccharide synthesis family protein
MGTIQPTEPESAPAKIKREVKQMESIRLKLPGSDDFFTQEAYKVLRTNLQFCGQEMKAIALTSCGENEGKTTVTLAIAKSFADMGKRVLVIDADMRKSVMAGRNTDAKDPRGLSEVLSGLANLGDCIYQVRNTSMHILFAGKYPPNPVELLGGKRFDAMLAEAKKFYDYIFIDTPPLGAVIDAAVAGSKCDGTVLVLGNRKVRYREAQEVLGQLEKSRCHVLGVVRNQSHIHGKGYYKKSAYYK